MNTANIAIVLDLAITALRNATEFNAMIVAAQQRGSDITDDEVNEMRSKAVAAVDALQAGIAAA